jgi:putative transposase
VTRRPSRLGSFDYTGFHQYFLTFCVMNRRRVFVTPAPVDESLSEISLVAGLYLFDVLAYCFMPDHLHVQVAGTSESSNLITFAHQLKQRTAFRYLQRGHERLWQKGYFEHVLRDDETALMVARYILANPVRAGLVKEPREYPFSGSLVFDKAQLDDLWAGPDVSVQGTAFYGRPDDGRGFRVGDGLHGRPGEARP